MNQRSRVRFPPGALLLLFVVKSTQAPNTHTHIDMLQNKWLKEWLTWGNCECSSSHFIKEQHKLNSCELYSKTCKEDDKNGGVIGSNLTAKGSAALLFLLALLLLVLGVGERLVEELLFNEAEHCSWVFRRSLEDLLDLQLDNLIGCDAEFKAEGHRAENAEIVADKADHCAPE